QKNVSLQKGKRKPRGAQLVVIQTPEGPLHLVNWHLGLAEGERRWQVHYLLNHDLFHVSKDLPTLVAGDFNDWRNTLSRLRFRLHRFEQITAPTRRFRSFPAFCPVASLDKVFRRGPIRIRHAGVVKSRLTRRASDHLPLVVDFSVEMAAPLPPSFWNGF
ncbi:MAG: endonuclease/exonuclease/phosphatase family protein, partial [Gemmataceae bacterium]